MNCKIEFWSPMSYSFTRNARRQTGKPSSSTMCLT